MELKVYATPTLYGEEAKKVLKEMQTEPSEKAIENGKKLVEYFKRFL